MIVSFLIIGSNGEYTIDYITDSLRTQNEKKVLPITSRTTIIERRTRNRMKKDWNEKMNKIKRILMLVLCLALLVQTIPIDAKKSKNKNKNYWPKQSEKITAGAALLMDLDTETLLYSKNIDKKYYPASITKILTVLLAVENSSMDEIVTFSEDSIYKTGGSGIARDVGEKMTMEECLYAVMLESANECAYAVAEHIAGSLNKFVKMMNDRAKKIGCTASHFVNPNGLPDKKHYVTARDMALIAKEAYANETFRLFCGTKRYTIQPTNKHKEPTYLLNHHKMLYPNETDAYLYDYCTGGKTGFTIAAGSTLVTYAEKDGMSLVAVILKGSSPQYWVETRALFDYGFENFNLCNVAEYAENENTNADEETKYDTLNTNEPYAQIDPQAKIILPKTVDFNKTTMKVNYDDLPKNVLAELEYNYGKRKIGVAHVIRTNATVDKNNIKTDDLEEHEPDTQIDQKNNEESENQLKKEADTPFFEKFDSKEFFSDIPGHMLDLFEMMLSNGIIVIVCIVIVILLLILFIYRTLFNRSYVLRQKIARRKSRKRERKQYITIYDTHNTRRRRRRKR